MMLEQAFLQGIILIWTGYVKNCHESPAPPEFQRTFAPICFKTANFVFCIEEIPSTL